MNMAQCKIQSFLKTLRVFFLLSFFVIWLIVSRTGALEMTRLNCNAQRLATAATWAEMLSQPRLGIIPYHQLCIWLYQWQKAAAFSSLPEIGSFPEWKVSKMQQLVFDYSLLISYHMYLQPKADPGVRRRWGQSPSLSVSKGPRTLALSIAIHVSGKLF